MKVYFLLVSWSQDVIQILFVELISVGFDDGRAIVRRVGVDPLADGSAGQARVDVAVGSKQRIAQRRSVAGNKLKLRGGQIWQRETSKIRKDSSSSTVGRSTYVLHSTSRRVV